MPARATRKDQFGGATILNYMVDFGRDCVARTRDPFRGSSRISNLVLFSHLPPSPPAHAHVVSTLIFFFLAVYLSTSAAPLLPRQKTNAGNQLNEPTTKFVRRRKEKGEYR